MLIDFYRERKGERGRGREVVGTTGQVERDRERQRDRETERNIYWFPPTHALTVVQT